MKFRFTGGRDCPDWVLSEVFALSKLTSIKTKLLCTQLCKLHLSGEETKHLDIDKLMKLTSDAKFRPEDIKGAASALTFILFSATKHNCKSDDVVSELQQLGLPKEHSLAVGKVYGDFRQPIESMLQASSLVIGGSASIQDWDVQELILPDQSQVVVTLKLSLR